LCPELLTGTFACASAENAVALTFRGQFAANTKKGRRQEYRPRSIICELPALRSEDLLFLSDLRAFALLLLFDVHFGFALWRPASAKLLYRALPSNTRKPSGGRLDRTL